MLVQKSNSVDWEAKSFFVSRLPTWHIVSVFRGQGKSCSSPVKKKSIIHCSSSTYKMSFFYKFSINLTGVTQKQPFQMSCETELFGYRVLEAEAQFCRDNGRWLAVGAFLLSDGYKVLLVESLKKTSGSVRSSLAHWSKFTSLCVMKPKSVGLQPRSIQLPRLKMFLCVLLTSIVSIETWSSSWNMITFIFAMDELATTTELQQSLI